MASMNMVDYDAIVAAYESIIRNESDWLLLRYADPRQPDDLSLVSHGSQGLSELKAQIEDLNQVFIAFLREDVPTNPGYVLINYIPHALSGVRRARTLVHSRRVGAAFRVDHGSLTVDHLSNLTQTAIHQAVLNPDAPHVIQMDRSISSPQEEPAFPRDSGAAIEPIRRAASEATSPPSTPQKSASMFSNFLRRKPAKATEDASTDRVQEDDLPPPAPPKDRKYSSASVPHPRQRHMSTGLGSSSYNTAMKSLPQVVPRNERRNSLSEFAVINSNSYSSDDAVVVESPSRPSADQIRLPPGNKWVSETTVIADPAERARRRRLAQKQREMEEEQAAREEAERQARIKRQKQEQLRLEQEAEEERRASLEDELKRITSERRRKEEAVRREEERKKQELEVRKQEEKARRIQEHRKLEEWRKAQARSAEENAKREAENLKEEQAERQKRIKGIAAKVKAGARSEELVTGWVTMQTSESLVWRRRFFKFADHTVLFYRSPKDTNQVLDKLELRGQLTGLREWNEGYEELKAIPHSFAIEFKDNREHWAMFADSQEEKDQVLGLLHYAAGL